MPLPDLIDPYVAEQSEAISVGTLRLGSWRLCLEREALSTPHLKQAYRAIAGRWGRALKKLKVADAYGALFQALPGLASLKASVEPVRVLDCGVGAGDFSAALADALDGNASITGVDVSPEMLALASENLDGQRDVTLREADVRSLPFPDDHFDVVIGAHVLEHLADPEIGFAEMMRVLKPGGRMVLCITQRSAFGFYIHLIWRTQVKPAAWWRAMLARSRQLRAVQRQEDIGGYFSRMSWVVTGVKVSAED
ncbi:MAG: methyltransferase domain-containing protein [Alphaproteobacteria bacterium]|nr:methyltransferase domain-containing protein [Alphaproteobacteria bacterium SS10]